MLRSASVFPSESDEGAASANDYPLGQAGVAGSNLDSCSMESIPGVSSVEAWPSIVCACFTDLRPLECPAGEVSCVPTLSMR
jgi:hypothetical protein